jgi:hypothetical protein
MGEGKRCYIAIRLLSRLRSLSVVVPLLLYKTSYISRCEQLKSYILCRLDQRNRFGLAKVFEPKQSHCEDIQYKA